MKIRPMKERRADAVFVGFDWKGTYKSNNAKDPKETIVEFIKTVERSRVESEYI